MKYLPLKDRPKNLKFYRKIFGDIMQIIKSKSGFTFVHEVAEKWLKTDKTGVTNISSLTAVTFKMFL
jgi:hypothetical protein